MMIAIRCREFWKRERAAGLWECEPGASRWEFFLRGEFVHVPPSRVPVERANRKDEQ